MAAWAPRWAPESEYSDLRWRWGLLHEPPTGDSEVTGVGLVGETVGQTLWNVSSVGIGQTTGGRMRWGMEGGG